MEGGFGFGGRLRFWREASEGDFGLEGRWRGFGGASEGLRRGFGGRRFGNLCAECRFLESQSTFNQLKPLKISALLFYFRVQAGIKARTQGRVQGRDLDWILLPVQ